MAPFALLADSFVIRTELLLASNRLNVAMMPTMFSVVAAGFWVVARAAVAAIGERLAGRVLLVSTLPALVAALYVLLPPDFVVERNALLVPRRLLGIVFSAEPFTYLYTGGVLLVLARVSRTGRGWNPWVVGAASGVAVILRESNVILVAVAFGLLLTFTGRRRLMAPTLAAAGAVVAGQAVYFLHVFGSPFLPNRQIYDGERWRSLAEERYGWRSSAPPPRMDLSYLPANLADVIGSYWLAVLIAVAALALLAVRRPAQWRTWVLAAAPAFVYLIFHAAYVHHLPIYRYNWSVVPAAAFVLSAAGTLALHHSGRVRGGRRA